MRPTIQYFAALMVLLLFGVRAQAAQNDSITSLLVSMGLENVRTKVSGDTIWMEYEDHTYRGTYRGTAEVLRTLDANPATRGYHYEIVVLDDMMPQVAVHADHLSVQWRLQADYQVRAARQHTASQKRQANSLGKIDIVVHPKVLFDNHRLDVPCEFAFSLAPSVEVATWPGAHLTIQPVLPVLTANILEGNSQGYARIGIIDLEQQYTRGPWLFKAAAGFFYTEQFGVNGEAWYNANSRLRLGAKVGYVGDAYRNYDGFKLYKANHLLALGQVSYYDPHTLLQGEITGGQFVYGDWGVRGDITRHFGDYAIGAWGYYSTEEFTVGIHFAIPLMGKKQHRKGWVRPRMPEYFNWTYNMVSNGVYVSKRMGRDYNTRADANHSARYWNAAYIEKNILRLLASPEGSSLNSL